ncbi:MAG: hypothetical protein EBU84_22035 [Actinobacteria bacterium]|jgi:hypothetical protein|nr:hypothetical protein [Actinomycetota bacterium]
MELIHKQKKQLVINQIKNIDDTLIKIKKQLFIATVAYEKYYKRYYNITLTLFIFSSIVTFIDALRLIIIEYVNKSKEILINEHLLTTFVNALLLSLGILITILTSFVRFKNYREILEELREKQNIMIGYIDKYNKQKNNLEFLYQTKEDDIKIEEIEKIKNDIAEYDTILVSTNILQFLTTQDIIKFNNYRLDFEYKKKEILFNYKKKIKTLEETDEENQTQHLTISNNSLSPSCEFFVL